MKNIESAATLLQETICDAFCSEDDDVRSLAVHWLMLEREPEALDYTKNGFIEVCSALDLDWKWLKATLRIGLPITKRSYGLGLVQLPEQRYKGEYEEDFNSNRASETKES